MEEGYDLAQPETEPLPGEWKRLPGFERLLVIRALRPDRTTLAVAMWVRDVLGAKYGEAIPFDLPLSFEDAGPATPIFFLLSPGVAVPMETLNAMGAPLGMTEDAGKFVAVSLGQGQEPVAEKALEVGASVGGWVLLQNIELVASWLPKLEKKLESLVEGAHPDFRVFLSALPQKVVPVGVLQNSIKLTNEPPSGLKANMLRAYGSFTETIWEATSKQSELKAIIFALCFFHSVVCERRKFGCALRETPSPLSLSAFSGSSLLIPSDPCRDLLRIHPSPFSRIAFRRVVARNAQAHRLEPRLPLQSG